MLLPNCLESSSDIVPNMPLPKLIYWGTSLKISSATRIILSVRWRQASRPLARLMWQWMPTSCRFLQDLIVPKASLYSSLPSSKPKREINAGQISILIRNPIEYLPLGWLSQYATTFFNSSRLSTFRIPFSSRCSYKASPFSGPLYTILAPCTRVFLQVCIPYRKQLPQSRQVP